MSRPTLPPPPDDVVPGPDDATTAAEQAQARAFGELLDKSLAGRTPPAMATSDRELLELATVIRAVKKPTELPDARAGSIVEAALAQAIGVADRPGILISDPGIVAITDRARPRASRAPWIVAGSSALVAAAAIIVLVAGVGRHAPVAPAAGPRTAARVPLHWQSRPADELVGVIPHERSGDAGARIDAIYADRLDGFRELTLAGRTHRRAP